MSNGDNTTFMIRIKLTVKKVISLVVAVAGHTGMLDFATGWVVFRLAPLLLDEAIIPNRPVPRRLRGLKARALCNPYSPFHRSMYWLGKLHERELDIFLRRVLRPGDHVVDIGANFGQISALAASLVGSGGSIIAFEPHPHLAQMIRDFLHGEVGDVVTVHAVALGDTPQSVKLRVRADALGQSNIGRYDDSETAQSHGFTQAMDVQQVVGDSVLGSLPNRGIVVVKLDVEGREPSVLRGMQQFLQSRVDAVVVEVTPQWIGGAAGVEAMFRQMNEFNFEAWMMDRTVRKLLWCRCGPRDVVEQTNVLFARRSMLISRGLLPADRGGTEVQRSTNKERLRV